MAHSLLINVGVTTGSLIGAFTGTLRGVGGRRGANVGGWMGAINVGTATGPLIGAFTGTLRGVGGRRGANVGRRVGGAGSGGGSFLVGIWTGGVLGARVGGFRGASVTGASVRTTKVI